MSRSSFAVLCAAALLACGEVSATNPHDPAAPESVQATGSISGRLVLPDGYGAARLDGARVLLEGRRGPAREAEPDGDGAFSFPEVVAGRYLLRAEVRGLDGDVRVVELGIGEERDLGEVPLRAVNEAESTGTAVGVARRTPSVGDEHGGIRVGARDTPFSTVTASDGAFELPLPAGRYTLDFEAPGYEPAELDDVTVVAGAETEPLSVFVRGRPGAVRGRLRVSADFSRPDLFADATVSRAASPDGDSEAAAVAEADGSFVFPAVPVGTWYVRVALPGFEPAVEVAVVEVDAATDLGFVDLRPSLEVGTLNGTARLAGAPEDGHAGIRVQVRDTTFSTETAADGAFSLVDLPVNRYQLVFSRPGYGTATLSDVDVGEGENGPVEVALAAAPGAIVGTVALPAAFADPGRVAEVELRLFDAAAPADAEPVALPTNPGADGFFTFAGVDVGLWRVEARLDGFRTFVDTRRLGPGERVDLGRIQLQPDVPDEGGAQTTWVAGVAHLEDAPGDTGHGGTRVEVEGTPYTAVTNDAGAFQVMVLGRETETLRFFHEGYASPAPAAVRGVVRGAYNALEGDVLLTARPGRVRGRVVLDRFGDEVQLGRVSVRLLDEDRELPPGVVGPDGGFAIGEVPAGRYILRASLDGYVAAELRVEVGVGAEVDVGGVLLRHASGTAAAVPLAGRVRLDGALDHTGIKVRVRFADRDRPFALATTDASGRFELPAADEPYNLVFERPEYTTVNPFGPVTWDGDGFVDANGDPIDVTLRRAPFDGRVTVRFSMAPGWIAPADRVATVRVRGAAGVPAPVTTGAGEEARFSGLAAGVWVVSVERPGFTVAERLVELRPGAEAARVEDVELRLVDLAAAQLDLTGIELTAADLDRISLVGADLTNVALRGDFSGTDLTAANLTNADLRGVVLRGARLGSARLFGADLRGADLRDANLRRASVFAANASPGEGGAPSRLEGADLRQADFSFAQLREARITSGAQRDVPPCTAPPPAPGPGEPADGVTRVAGARFNRADLGGATLDGLFFGADLEAELPGAVLSAARLVRTGLSGACLRGVELTLADLTRARLARADLRDAFLASAVLQGADLRGADLRGAQLLSAVLHTARAGCLATTDGFCACAEPVTATDEGGECDDAAPDFEPATWDERCGCRTRLTGAEFNGANLVGADLTGADLRGATLAGATTGDARVDVDRGVPYPERPPFDCVLPEGCDWPPDAGCDLSGVRECRVLPTRLAQASLDGADLSGVVLAHVDFTDASLRDAVLTNTVVSPDTTLRGARADGADLSDATLAGVDLTGLGAPGVRLVRTDLGAAALVDVDFSGGHLEQVEGLQSAEIRGLNLSGASILGTELPTEARGLDMRRATVEARAAVLPPGTRLDDATLRLTWIGFDDLVWVRLSGADLRESPVMPRVEACDAAGVRLAASAQFVTRSRLRDARLDGLELGNNHSFEQTDLRGASLRGVRATNARFRSGSLRGADLEGATLVGVRFDGADLAGGALGGASIESVSLHAADLRDAGLGAAALRASTLTSSDLRGADLRQAAWVDVELGACDLTGAQLRGAELTGGRLDRIEVDGLAGASLTDVQFWLTDVTGADLTDFTMSGGALFGVNIDDAAATEGMALNPDHRDDSADLVGGAIGDPEGHFCTIAGQCDGDIAQLCADLRAACDAPGYPESACIEGPLGSPDESCALLVGPFGGCFEWEQGFRNDLSFREHCSWVKSTHCCAGGQIDLAQKNLARSDLRALLAGGPNTARSNLDRTDLRAIGVAFNQQLSPTLRGADLSGASGTLRLSETTLAGANLSGFEGSMYLSGVDLRDARLEDATLGVLSLERVTLRGETAAPWLMGATAMSQVDIRDVTLGAASLAGKALQDLLFDRADLRDADLSDTTLRRSLGIGARLAGANLEGATLSEVGLWEADLSDANLAGATIEDSPLFCANLSGATLRGAVLRRFYPLGCIDLTDADLRDVDFESGDLWGATLAGADLTGGDLAGHFLADTDLAGVVLVGAELGGAVVSRSNAAGADLTGAHAFGLVGIEADLRDATLADADLREAVLSDANLAGADLSGADLLAADLSRADLSAANLRRARLGNLRLTGANLEGAEVCASAPAGIRERPGVVVDEGC